MARSDWFVADDSGYIEAHLTQKGEIWVAQCETGRLGAFLIVHLPGSFSDNLGEFLQLCREGWSQVAHMESIAVYPDFRGHSLQRQLLQRAEKSMCS